MEKSEWKQAVVDEVNRQRPEVVAVRRILLEGVYERQGQFEGVEDAVREVLRPEHAWALETTD